MPSGLKKSIGCLLLLLLCLLIYSVIDTYGLFEDNVDRKVQANVAAFTIKINNSDINGTNKAFTINDIVSNTNPNVAGNKIAPGSSGYFDIILDPTNVDVALKYAITYDLSNIKNDKIVMTSVNNNTLGEGLIRTDVNTYSGIINLTNVKNNVVMTIRTNFEWTNDESNNDNDNTLKTIDKIGIPVSILITQYEGETITQYQEE